VNSFIKEVNTMALMHWTPMDNLASFQHEMNRMFDQFFRGGNGHETGATVGAWTPAVDIHETDDGYVLKAELPGVSKDDVSIDMHQNTLTLSGQRKYESAVKDEHYHRVERAYGTFRRSFVLPAKVDQDQVQATFKDGVLELHLPKSEAAKPKHIAING
jgi:HSP20 family protein